MAKKGINVPVAVLPPLDYYLNRVLDIKDFRLLARLRQHSSRNT